jgi:predicted thioesterase
VRVELDHLLPTRVGETVRVSAVLAGASGRRLTFEVRVHDADERALAVGVVIRAVAPRSRFA